MADLTTQELLDTERTLHAAWRKRAEEAEAELAAYRRPSPADLGVREALEWYGENARLCRLIHSEGDAGRNALAADGGKRARAALAASRTEMAVPDGWRCFHCDEVFTDKQAALEHFGDGGGCDPEPPACKLNQMEGGLLKLYREALAELQTWQIEDNASAREFYALGAEHQTALRREEEKGYVRGLEDGRALSASPSGMEPQLRQKRADIP